jgi:hypothetical protein
MYVTWFTWTIIYPICDIPVGISFDVGWITFHCLGTGMTEIVEGLGPTGMQLIYTNGETATDYYPNWVVLVIDVGLGIKEDGVRDVPRVNFLSNARPSLFRFSTDIHYGIAEDGPVNLTVYNSAGQALRKLVNDHLETGSYRVAWEGEDDAGRRLPSGVYFLKLEANSFHCVRKVVLK